jgi:hypothetical protein
MLPAEMNMPPAHLRLLPAPQSLKRLVPCATRPQPVRERIPEDMRRNVGWISMLAGVGKGSSNRLERPANTWAAYFLQANTNEHRH